MKKQQKKITKTLKSQSMSGRVTHCKLHIAHVLFMARIKRKSTVNIIDQIENLANSLYIYIYIYIFTSEYENYLKAKDQTLNDIKNNNNNSKK